MNIILRSLCIGLLSTLSCLPNQLIAQCDSAAIDLPYNSIDEDCDGLDEFRILLPPYLYATEGKEFSMLYANVFLSKYSSKYKTEVVSNLQGIKTATNWKYTPVAADAGEHPITLRVLDNSNRVIAQVSSTLRISAQQSPAGIGAKRMIILGHSLVDQGVTPYYMRLATNAPGTPPVSYHGTRLSWSDNITRHEGRGGASWRFFATDPTSPLFTDGQLNLTAYFDSVICPGCKPDYLVIHLDVNDYGFVGILNGKILNEIEDFIQTDYEERIEPFIAAIRANSPNTKIGICITPPANARPNVMSTFFSTIDPNSILRDLWRWRKIIHVTRQKYIQFFGNREDENISLVPIHTGVDEINMFNDDDPIHPYPVTNGSNGYEPIARDMYGWLKWQLAKNTTGGCQVNGLAKDIECDRKGTPNILTDDEFKFTLTANGLNAGTDYTAVLSSNSSPSVFDGVFGVDKPVSLLQADRTYTVELISKINTNCKTKLSVSASACSFGQAFTDLELTSSAPNTKPQPFTGFKATFTLKNKSANTASEVFVKLPGAPGKVSYPFPEPYTATQGKLDWSYSGLWDVGTLPPNGVASITLDYYLLSNEIFPIWGEVYHALQEDPNSFPANGNGITPQENDESALIIGINNTDEPSVNKSKLKVYPNPVSNGRVTVSMPAETDQILLYTVDGHQLASWNVKLFADLNQAVLTLPEQLGTGLYLLSAKGAGVHTQVKLVVY
jgi:hypothetical protein